MHTQGREAVGRLTTGRAGGEGKGGCRGGGGDDQGSCNLSSGESIKNQLLFVSRKLNCAPQIQLNRKPNWEEQI